jgi:hypothetical protein
VITGLYSVQHISYRHYMIEGGRSLNYELCILDVGNIITFGATNAVDELWFGITASRANKDSVAVKREPGLILVIFHSLFLPVQLENGDTSDAKGNDDDVRNDSNKIDDDTEIRCSRQDQTNGRQGEQRGEVDAEEVSTLWIGVSIYI